jgi:hemerythrin-like domain-containing protein
MSSRRILGKDETQAFRTAVETLATMNRAHIEFEDSVLFPLANRVLGAAQAAEIAADMAKRRNLDI